MVAVLEGDRLVLSGWYRGSSPVRAQADIMGVLIDRVDLFQVERRISHFVSTGMPHQIVTVNMDFISRSLRDPRFMDLINSAALSVADGMPVLWAARALGDHLPERVTGMDILRMCCRLAQRKGDGVFLLGAEPGVAQQASNVLCRQYPDLRIAGTYSPPFGEFCEDENKRMVDQIVDSGAKYLFVAFGCPKQDFWIQKHLSDLGVPVCVGIGGVFNYLTGRVKRAPEVVQNMGFEWLFRMVQQPQLARRYMINDLPVFVKAISYGLASAPAKIGHQNATKRLLTGSAGLSGFNLWE